MAGASTTQCLGADPPRVPVALRVFAGPRDGGGLPDKRGVTEGRRGKTAGRRRQGHPRSRPASLAEAGHAERVLGGEPCDRADGRPARAAGSNGVLRAVSLLAEAERVPDGVEVHHESTVEAGLVIVPLGAGGEDGRL